MPKVVGVRERRHQPFYDTLIRCNNNISPPILLSQTTKLFASGINLSNTEWTNMATAGALASDQTLVILAMRCLLWFKGGHALDMLKLCAHQLYLNLYVGDKSMFLSPCWMFPAGGGIDAPGDVLNGNNGVASQEAILKFAKAIPVPARQHFNVEATFYDTGSTSVRAQYLNVDKYTPPQGAPEEVGMREIKVFLDGLNTRDVQ